jgi:hypothetical protein
VDSEDGGAVRLVNKQDVICRLESSPFYAFWFSKPTKMAAMTLIAAFLHSFSVVAAGK